MSPRDIAAGSMKRNRFRRRSTEWFGTGGASGSFRPAPARPRRDRPRRGRAFPRGGDRLVEAIVMRYPSQVFQEDVVRMSLRLARLRHLASALLAGLGLGQTAAVAQSADIIRAQTGEWLVASDDGKPGCRINLKAQTTVGGMVAVPAKDCTTRVPRLADVAAWRFSDGVTLADAVRKPIMVFGEDETGILKTRPGAPPAFYMFKAKPGVDRAPHAAAIFGTWQMRRPKGAAICAVTFQDRPPKGGGEESYGLLLDPACDASIKRLKLVSWRIEDVSLMLYGTDDGSLKFEPIVEGFERIGEPKARPLHLVRQP